MACGTDRAAIGAEFHHRPECSRSRLGALINLAEDPAEDLWAGMRHAASCEILGIDPERLNAETIAKSA